jgi:hypothetical protein
MTYIETGEVTGKEGAGALGVVKEFCLRRK